MSATIKGLSVTLAPGVREEQADKIISAIKMLQGVLDVKEYEEGGDHWMARTQIRRELADKLWKVLADE